MKFSFSATFFIIFHQEIIPVLRAFILLVLAILGIFLLAILTPWLINEQGTWGILATPFVWFAFIAAAWRCNGWVDSKKTTT